MSSSPHSDPDKDTPGEGHNGGPPLDPVFDPSLPLPPDFEKQLLEGLVKRLLQRVQDPKVEMGVSEMELIRKLSESNSISFSSIRRGDFGEVAQKAAEEEFPFDDEGRLK